MKYFKKWLMYSVAQVGVVAATSANAQVIPDFGNIKNAIESHYEEKAKAYRDSHPAFPNLWTGNLPRPILFVHGISSDGYGTWGFGKPICEKLEKIEYQESKNGTIYTAVCKNGHVIKGNTGNFNEADIVHKVVLTSTATSHGPYMHHETTKYQGDLRNGCSPAQRKYPCTEVIGSPQQLSLSYIRLNRAIANDIYSSSYRKLGIPSEYAAWEGGIAFFYEENSTPAYLAQRYGLDTRYDQSKPTTRINHNGLEFYNISKIDVTSTSPLTTDKKSYVHPQDQAKDLRNKVIQVLNEYYPDWQKNPNAMIDLVVHSQGGLVARSMLQKETRSNDVSNPLNHINHIVTIDTPHLGTALPHTKRGISSVMKLSDYILNDIENLDSVRVLGAFSIDPLPAKMLEPVHVLHENAQHLRYACNLHNPNWEPKASDISDPLKMESQERVQMCVDNVPTLFGKRLIDNADSKCKTDLETMVDSWYLGNDADCSSYITELQKTGYPKAPNGRYIPMTAMYGRLNPDGFMKLLEKAKELALDECDNLKAKATFGDCEYKIRRLVNGIIHITRDGLGNEWAAHSDFAVDVASQVGLGLFDEKKHPFKKVEIVPLNPDVGVFHMDMSGAEDIVGQKLPGAAWHAEQIFNVLQDKPKAKMNMTPQYLLLLQN